jgi:hypothetical protein
MTDEEFFTTMGSLRDHANRRRQESLTAADVEMFKRWDALFGRLDTVLLQRATEKSLKELQGN